MPGCLAGLHDYLALKSSSRLLSLLLESRSSIIESKLSPKVPSWDNFSYVLNETLIVLFADCNLTYYGG